jgi:hypothetical protein
MIGLKGWVGGGAKSQDGKKARSSLNIQYSTLCPEDLCMYIRKKLQTVKTHIIVNGATRFSSSGFFHESVSPSL